jgi:hypothetical protein
MSVRAKAPTGRPGDWMAYDHQEQTDLPCVWKTCMKAKTYRDEGFDVARAKDRNYIDAIRTSKRVILTKMKPERVNGHPSRDGYVGLFQVDNVVFEDGNLSFDFVARLKSYKN